MGSINDGSELLSGGLFLAQSFERLGLQLAPLLHQDLDFALRGFEFLTAGIGKADSFFKQLQRLLEGEISTFELFDDFF